MDADEQIIARETLAHETRFRGDYHWVGVLDEEGGDRRPVAEIAPVAGEDRTNARLVENAGRRVENVEPFDQGAVERGIRSWFDSSAPPPSYCHAPVTAGRQVTAKTCAAPLREREKP